MILFRFGFVLCCSLVAMFTFSVERAVYAATTYSSVYIEIREGNTDYSVNVPATWTDYGNGEDCGNTAHKTSKGGRFFGHIHFSVTLPVNGVVVIGATTTSKTVTTANVKAYWDNKYGSNYTSSGGENPNYNCWGYAFGNSIWIQDPSYIYADDYSSTQTPVAGCLIAQSGHVIKVSEVGSNESKKVVTKTSEKNRYSGIYNRTYPLPDGGNFSSFYEKKP